MPSYIPTGQEALRSWANNFAGLITADPAKYALQPADAVLIQDAADDYDAKLTIALDPDTRTVVTIAAKDGAKAYGLTLWRAYAQQIKANLGVSNEDKLALGLNLDDDTPTPVPPPSTNPLLSIVASQAGVQTLRYADATTPDKRSKPTGVSHLVIYVNLRTPGDPAPMGATPCDYKMIATRQPVAVPFDPEDAGKIARYWGRWSNRKGEVGPWSPATELVVS